MPDLTTLAYVKAALGVPGTAQDARLAALLTAASESVRSYVQRDLLADTYTEYLSGNNTLRLALRQRPVTAVSSVWLDPRGYFGTGTDAFGSTTLLTEGTDYVLQLDRGTSASRSGVLIHLHTVWPMVNRSSFPTRVTTEVSPAFGNVKVAYSAGWALDAMPADIQYAVALIIRQMLMHLDRGGMLASERIGDYAYTLAHGLVTGRGAELADVRNTLAPYREIGW